MTVFGLVVLVTLNILMFAIVIIALAGTKGKLDTVDIMFRHWANRQGVAPKRRFTDDDYVCMEFALNSLIKENKDEFEMSAQVEEWEMIVEKVRKM